MTFTCRTTLRNLCLMWAGMRLCASTLCPSFATSTNMLPWGSNWRVLANGNNPGGLWAQFSYNDAAWPMAPGLLGFGDPDIISVLPDKNGFNQSIMSYYFRHTLIAGDLSNCEAIRLDLIRDDGAVVYVNEIEVLRNNMAPGALSSGSSALSDIVGASEREVVTRYLDPAWLSGRTNLIAVRIHQSGPNNEDLAFDLALTGLSTAPPPSVVRAPYLQSGAPTALTVCWRTDLRSASCVWYSELGSSVTNVMVINESVVDHEVRVTGLTPSTRYQYGIGATNLLLRGMDAQHTFETSPAVGSAAAMRFWVIGDSGTANNDARAVRDYMHAWTGEHPSDFWIMLGDNAYNSGTGAEYEQAVFQIYTNTLRTQVAWSTLGNHDGRAADSATQSGPYYDIFSLPRVGECGGLASGTEAYYAFDYANVHFVCLESYETDRSTNGMMMTWLRNDLATTTQKWIIAYWHHPPYTRGSHNSDAEQNLIQMRQNALPILEAAGVDLVLSGHSHSYERSKFIHGHYGSSSTLTASNLIDSGSGTVGVDGPYAKLSTTGAVYAVCGSSGKTSNGSFNHPVMQVSLRTLGSMIIDVEGDRLDAYFLGTDQVWDQFSIVKRDDFYTLATGAQGPGTVVPSTDIHFSGSTVTVSAAASPYHFFDRWNGDISSLSNDVTITVQSNMTVSAAFEPFRVSHQVPVYWLVDQGLGTNDADAFIDVDEDGLLAWQEFHAGTFENNASSLLSVSALSLTNVTLSHAQLQWMSVSGQLYTVTWSSNMTDAGSAVATNIVATPPINTLTDLRGVAVRGGVYRLKTWRP